MELLPYDMWREVLGWGVGGFSVLGLFDEMAEMVGGSG